MTKKRQGKKTWQNLNSYNSYDTLPTGRQTNPKPFTRCEKFFFQKWFFFNHSKSGWTKMMKKFGTKIRLTIKKTILSEMRTEWRKKCCDEVFGRCFENSVYFSFIPLSFSTFCGILHFDCIVLQLIYSFCFAPTVSTPVMALAHLKAWNTTWMGLIWTLSEVRCAGAKID